MNAPDRSAEVAAIVERFRHLFGSDDSRRAILYHLCAELNLVDDGEWGLLEKRDQGGFIPSDVIVWFSSREHFDVLGSDPDRPTWQPRGVLSNLDWVWRAAPPVGPVPVPPSDRPELPADADAQVDRFLDALERIYDGLAGVADAIHAVDRRVAAVQKDGLKLRVR